MRYVRGRRATRGGQGDRGAAAVEFALVLIPLFLLVFGIIVYGFVFNAKVDLQTQARNAARDAAAAMPTQTCDEIRANAAPDDPPMGSSTTIDVAGCNDALATPCTTGNSAVTVTVTTTFNNPVPLIPAPATVSGTGEFPCEGVIS